MEEAARRLAAARAEEAEKLMVGPQKPAAPGRTTDPEASPRADSG